MKSFREQYREDLIHEIKMKPYGRTLGVTYYAERYHTSVKVTMEVMNELCRDGYLKRVSGGRRGGVRYKIIYEGGYT